MSTIRAAATGLKGNHRCPPTRVRVSAWHAPTSGFSTTVFLHDGRPRKPKALCDRYRTIQRAGDAAEQQLRGEDEGCPLPILRSCS